MNAAGAASSSFNASAFTAPPCSAKSKKKRFARLKLARVSAAALINALAGDRALTAEQIDAIHAFAAGIKAICALLPQLAASNLSITHEVEDPDDAVDDLDPGVEKRRQAIAAYIKKLALELHGGASIEAALGRRLTEEVVGNWPGLQGMLEKSNRAACEIVQRKFDKATADHEFETAALRRQCQELIEEGHRRLEAATAHHEAEAADFRLHYEGQLEDRHTLLDRAEAAEVTLEKQEGALEESQTHVRRATQEAGAQAMYAQSLETELVNCGWARELAAAALIISTDRARTENALALFLTGRLTELEGECTELRSALVEARRDRDWFNLLFSLAETRATKLAQTNETLAVSAASVMDEPLPDPPTRPRSPGALRRVTAYVRAAVSRALRCFK